MVSADCADLRRFPRQQRRELDWLNACGHEWLFPRSLIAPSALGAAMSDFSLRKIFNEDRIPTCILHIEC